LIEIEKAVLAWFLNRKADDLLAKLSPEHFSNQACRRVYEAIKALFLEGKEINAVSVATKLGGKASEVMAIDEVFLHMAGTRAEIEELVQKLHSLYVRRGLIRRLKAALNALENGKDALEIKNAVISALENIETLEERSPQPLLKVINDTFEFLERQHKYHTENRILKTHLDALNDLLGGLLGGDMIIVGGRPSAGKTAFALDLVLHFGEQGKKTLFVTREMTPTALCLRLLGGRAGVNSLNLRTGNILDWQWRALTRAMGPISEYTIFFDDVSDKVSDIRVWAKEIKTQHGLDVIVVDYLQLLEPERHEDTREREVAGMSRALKKLALELDVPIIVLTQLNRNAEGKRPTLADLRESGAIEQDADVVIFLWRPEEVPDEWKSRKEKIEKVGCRLIEAVVAKQRNGPVGSFYMLYNPLKCSFECLKESGRERDELDRAEQAS